MRIVEILLVEDDDVEIMSVRRALSTLDVPHRLVVARDGLEALCWMQGENGIATSGAPFVIFLDINMPRMNGIEFLRELRADLRFASTAVVILTTSTADADRQRASAANVADYIVKSALGHGFASFTEAIRVSLARLFPDKAHTVRKGRIPPQPSRTTLFQNASARIGETEIPATSVPKTL
jgi:CheY-like chemotaxis protein